MAKLLFKIKIHKILTLNIHKIHIKKKILRQTYLGQHKAVVPKRSPGPRAPGQLYGALQPLDLPHQGRPAQQRGPIYPLGGALSKYKIYENKFFLFNLYILMFMKIKDLNLN